MRTSPHSDTSHRVNSSQVTTAPESGPGTALVAWASRSHHRPLSRCLSAAATSSAMLSVPPSRSISRSPSSLQEVVHPPKEVEEEEGKSLGGKSLGSVLSFIFVINQIYGPGVLAIPLVYQQSGLLATLAMVTFFLVVSSLASTCLAQAIASIPDNSQYEQRVEFGTAVKYYFGPRWHVLFQICLNITIMSYLIASVVICAQSVDQGLIALCGRTWALEWGPRFGFHAFDDFDQLFSQGHITISLGYMVILVLFMPAGWLNLDDNVRTVQVGSFVFLVLLMLEFVAFFIWRGDHTGYHSVPVFGHTYPQLVSVFIFSWAYVIFVPSWLNEKSTSTSVNRVIWSSGLASWVGYIAVGLLCASVFGSSDIGLDNMLVSLSKSNMPTLTRVTAYLFSLGVIAPGIPVCSVTTRYNLFVGGVCGKKQSYFWACVAPWLVGWLFCQGELFANLLNWTSLVFNGLVNFLVPFLMYLTSLHFVHTGGAPVDIAPDDGAEQEEWEGEKAVATDDGEEDLAEPVMNNGSRTPIVRADSHSGGLQINDGGPAWLGPAAIPVTSSLHAPLLLAITEPETPRKQHVPTTHVRILLPTSASQPDCHPRPSAARHRHWLVRWCSPGPNVDYSHGPVYPFPKRLRPYAYQIVVVLIVLTEGIIIAQTVVDAIFAIQGKDALG